MHSALPVEALAAEEAEELLAAKDPLLCFRIAREWEEGREASAELCEEACHLLQRPTDAVLREYTELTDLAELEAAVSLLCS